MDIVNFLDKVEKWANEEVMINSLILVGEYARGQAREDSDIDFIIISTTPKLLIEDENFIKNFGRVEKLEKEKRGMLTSIRVQYEDGVKVKFGITSPLWICKPLDERTLEVLQDGHRVIVDKKNYFTNMILR